MVGGGVVGSIGLGGVLVLRLLYRFCLNIMLFL